MPAAGPGPFILGKGKDSAAPVKGADPAGAGSACAALKPGGIGAADAGENDD